jgi:TonB family protein
MRSLVVAFVVFCGLAFIHQAVCQTSPPASNPSCSGITALGSNWTEDQRQWIKDVLTPSIQKQVAAHWYVKQLFGIPPAHVCVEFQIQTDGTITGASIVESSHSDFLDQSAIRAVKAASPVDPLPKGLPVKFIEVGYLFNYKMTNEPYVLLSQAPDSIKGSLPENPGFSVVLSVKPSLVEPLSALKECCLEKWAHAVQQKWVSLASFAKDQNLVEIEAEIDPDGGITNLQMSNPSGNGRIDRAAVESLSGSKLAISVPLKNPVKIRVDFLANRTPDDVLVSTRF